MDHLSFIFYLKRVLPDIDLNNFKDRQIRNSTNQYETIDVTEILSDYFDKKRSKYLKTSNTALNELQTEAQCINKLFPNLTNKYILEQLAIFKDMPHRKEIVLRNIIHSKLQNSTVNNPTVLGVKRTVPGVQLADNMLRVHPIKIRKIVIPPTTKETSVSNTKMINTLPNINGYRVSVFNDGIQQPQEMPKTYKYNTTYTVVQKEENSCTGDVQIVEESALPVTKPCTISSPDDASDVSKQKDPSFSVIDEILSPVSSGFTTNSTNQSYGLMEQKEHIPVLDENIVNKVLWPFEETSQTITLKTTEEVATNSDVPKLGETVVAEPNSINFLIEAANTVTADLEKEKAAKSFEDFFDTIENPNEPTIKAENDTVTLTYNSQTHGNATDKTFNKNPSADNNQCLDNIPSTSKQLQEVNMATGLEDFDLTEYLLEVTSAPVNVIVKHCRKLNLAAHTRPSPPLLDLVIDNILTNRISSDSDSDEDEVNLGNFRNNLVDQLIGSFPIKRSKVQPVNCLKSVVPHTYKPNVMSNSVSEVKIKPQSSGCNSKNVPNIKPINFSINNQLVNYLCGVFPDACPNYIKDLCIGKQMSNEVLDELITTVLNTNNQYPKRPPVTVEPDIFPENQFEILKEFLPDADPDYLRMMFDSFEGKPEKVKAFLNEAMEHKKYPTMKDYQRRQQLSAQHKQYTTEFNVENFIKVIPDPEAFFSDASRVIKMDDLSSHYALVFLRNSFNKLPLRLIQSTFTKNGAKLYNTVIELKKAMKQTNLLMKSVRKPIELPNNLQNIPLLQEIAYFAHEKEILKYLQQIRENEETERKEAVSKGLMKTCGCCCDDEVLPKDLFSCEKGCSFCKSCILKSTEIRFGEGKLDFPCLGNCDSSFSLQILQAVLSPKLFSKIAQKKALEEVKAAGIEELEMCPFCDFATIPAEGYSIFSCLNPECMKESCRFCKEPSHIPLRCDEIEKDEDVKARTFVENKMTEALLKKCWKCGIKFFKEEGCNKMTCSCGAQMCYVCGKPVTSYKHFNGNGGDRFDLCPLYSDANVLNKENVLRGAEQAKAEIGNKNLKHDPTKDVQQHYEQRSAKVPQQHLLNPVQHQLQHHGRLIAMRMRELFPEINGGHPL